MELASWNSLIDQCYLAAHDDAVWQSFVAESASAFNSSVAGLQLDASKNPVGENSAAQVNFDLHALEKYFGEFNSPDLNAGMRAVVNSTPGQAFRISDFMDAEFFRTEASTRAILHPQSIDRGLMVSLCRPDAEFAWFNLYRNKNDGDCDFTQRDVRLFTQLGEHMLRGAELRNRIYFNQNGAISGMDEVLGDYYSDGLMSLSSSGHVLSLDENAERILNADLGLRLSRGKLQTSAKRDTTNAEALQAFLDRPAHLTEPLVLRSRQNLLLMLHTYPAPSSPTFAHQGAQQIVRIAVNNIGGSIDSSVVKDAFDLTPAEQSVVAMLTKTGSASASARKLGLSRETVKTHLRSIYGKTGTSSLTQLMLLIGKLVNR